MKYEMMELPTSVIHSKFGDVNVTVRCSHQICLYTEHNKPIKVNNTMYIVQHLTVDKLDDGTWRMSDAWRSLQKFDGTWRDDRSPTSSASKKFAEEFDPAISEWVKINSALLLAGERICRNNEMVHYQHKIDEVHATLATAQEEFDKAEKALQHALDPEKAEEILRGPRWT